MSDTVNDLGFVKTIDGLGQSIVTRVADAAHRGFDASFRQALGIFDRDILGGFNRSSQHVQFDWPASTGPEVRREFSIRGSCGAVY